MAISGDPYCTSAWNGFLLNLKHLIKFYFANALAGALTFMGCLVIAGVNTGIGYIFLRYVFNVEHKLNSVWVPIGVIIFVSFVTALLFLTIFDYAVESFLMSFAVDTELNGEPTFGPPTLHEKLEKIGFKKKGGRAVQPELAIDVNNLGGKVGKA